MSREEYQAGARPRSPDRSTLSDHVDLGKPGRGAVITSFTSRFRGSGPVSSLINTLVPPAKVLGFSQGLYSGVGELPAHKIRSLISEYV